MEAAGTNGAYRAEQEVHYENLPHLYPQRETDCHLREIRLQYSEFQRAGAEPIHQNVAYHFQMMHVSGHKTQKTFMDYIKLSSEDIADEIASMSKKENDIW